MTLTAPVQRSITAPLNAARQPVTEAGRLEVLPFLRQQAVSTTAHRFGAPNHLTDALI